MELFWRRIHQCWTIVVLNLLLFQRFVLHVFVCYFESPPRAIGRRDVPGHSIAFVIAPNHEDRERFYVIHLIYYPMYSTLQNLCNTSFLAVRDQRNSQIPSSSIPPLQIRQLRARQTKRRISQVTFRVHAIWTFPPSKHNRGNPKPVQQRAMPS